MTKQIENISTVCLQTLIAWRKSDCLITVCQILGGGGKSGSSNLLVEIIIVLSLKDDDILIVHISILLCCSSRKVWDALYNIMLSGRNKIAPCGV